jgi:putative endonuclease
MPYYVYSTTNPARKVLYIGGTGNLPNAWHNIIRIGVPRRLLPGSISAAIWYMSNKHADSSVAIAREKELKGWTRAKKSTLITTVNPTWEFRAL